jgi:soluble lytic murein transglycosylase-like protein
LAQAAPQQMPQHMPQQMAPQQMAQQLPENQPGVAQLPTGMPQGMASGGIVAFAGGDLVDDEEEDDLYEKQAQRDEGRIRNLIAGMRARASDAVTSVPAAISAIPRAVESAASGIKSFVRNPPKSYETEKAAAASRPSVQEADVEGFLSKIQHLESRGKHYDAKGNILTSPKGAEGIMQVMPKTQRNPGYGVTPARDRSPEELERVGKEYGLAMLREFKDPKLAAMAYNWGPGNVKKWLASDRQAPIPKETQQYASHFAKGGIASFAKGDLIDDEYGTPYNPYAMMGDLGVSQPSYRGNLDMGIGQFIKRKLMGVQDAPSPNTVSMPSAQDWQKFDQASALFEAEQKLNKPTPSAYVPLDSYDIGFGANKFQPDSVIEQAGPKRPSYYEDAMARIVQEREALKEQAQTDKYLAMLQASLGMMAGTSPYAMANIGQGGMQGVAAYAGAKKQRAAESAALGKEELAVKRLEQLSDSEKAALELAAEDKRVRAKLGQSRFEQEQSEFDRKRIEVARDDLKQYLALQDAQLKARFPLGEMDPKYAKARADLFSNDPIIQQLQREAFPRSYANMQKPAGDTATGGWSIKQK